MGLISDIHYIKSFAVYIVVVLSVMFYGRLTRPSQYPIAWTRWIFMFLTLAFWSAASQTVVSLLATCILAARAPYMELSSLVVTLCDHQQKLRQHWRLEHDFLLGGYVAYDFIKCPLSAATRLALAEITAAVQLSKFVIHASLHIPFNQFILSEWW